MEKLIITGPCQLRGDIQVSGSKNAALPILAAIVLAPGKYRISNMPMITDIENLLSILIDMGATAKLAVLRKEFVTWEAVSRGADFPK